MTETLVFFSIGGNLGDRLALIEETRDFIDFNIGDIVLQSSIYETAAWGMTPETPSFYNQVLGVRTELTLAQIKQEIFEIDEYYGRVRKGNGYENREMDVDVLFYKNECHEEPLMVPHPKIQDRAFILIPLNEIAPDWIHPQLNQTIQSLCKACKDEGSIKKI
jgi:2-amino-4-hydroxy-6-hydroxymethyldihydropteridine diphosphokinase